MAWKRGFYLIAHLQLLLLASTSSTCLPLLPLPTSITRSYNLFHICFFSLFFPLNLEFSFILFPEREHIKHNITRPRKLCNYKCAWFFTSLACQSAQTGKTRGSFTPILCLTHKNKDLRRTFKSTAWSSWHGGPSEPCGVYVKIFHPFNHKVQVFDQKKFNIYKRQTIAKRFTLRRYRWQ